MSEWFNRAQNYEWTWGIRWLQGRHPESPGVDIIGEFFNDDYTLYDQFGKDMRGKTVVEVGCGPNPIISSFPAAKHIYIEPLMAKYKEYIKLPETGIIMSVPVEEAGLIAVADGAVVSRNCIDHSETPLAALDAILKIAKPGAYLLFWSDLWHYPEPDEGHRNVTQQPEEIRQRVLDAGYEILRPVNVRQHPLNVSWGCFARRLS